MSRPFLVLIVLNFLFSLIIFHEVTERNKSSYNQKIAQAYVLGRATAFETLNRQLLSDVCKVTFINTPFSNLAMFDKNNNLVLKGVNID